MDIPQFFHSTTERLLGYFQFWATIHKRVVNALMQAFVGTDFYYICKYLVAQLSEGKIKESLTLYKTYKSPSIAAPFYIPNNYTEVPVCTHFGQHFVFLDFWILSEKC
jgi:hypothetical protein